MYPSCRLYNECSWTCRSSKISTTIPWRCVLSNPIPIGPKCQVGWLQGLSVETVEDNMFEWKCSIKASVCSYKFAFLNIVIQRHLRWPYAVQEPVQRWHILLQPLSPRELPFQGSFGKQPINCATCSLRAILNR